MITNLLQIIILLITSHFALTAFLYLFNHSAITFVRTSISLTRYSYRTRLNFIIFTIVMFTLSFGKAGAQIVHEKDDFIKIYPSQTSRKPYFSKDIQIHSHFRDDKLSDFTLIKLINHESNEYLFVVSKNSTILQLNPNNLQIVKNYRDDICDSSRSCENEIFINYLASINRDGYHSFFFCYIQLQQEINTLASPISTCMLPKNRILIKPITWSLMGYAASYPDNQTHVVLTDKYSFTGTFCDGSLKIIRVKLPEYIGRMYDYQDLVTPMAPFYFEEKSKFITSFRTEYEVYFLLVEYVDAKIAGVVTDCDQTPIIKSTKSDSFSSSSSSSSSYSSQSKIYIEVTRLIRICIDDPGSPTDFKTRNFGTIAKSNVICHVGEGKARYTYTRAISATWSGRRLFVHFSSQKNGPPGGIICSYDYSTFNESFDGPVRHQWTPPSCNENSVSNNNGESVVSEQNSNTQHQPANLIINKVNIPFLNMQKNIQNKLPKICERLSQRTLNPEEINVALTFASNGLYRTVNVVPNARQPLLQLNYTSYHRMKSISIPSSDYELVLLYNHDKIQMFVYYNYDNTYHGTNTNLMCYFGSYFSVKHNIQEVEISFVKSGKNKGIWLYVSESDGILKSQLDQCDNYSTSQDKCLNDSPEFCNWNRYMLKCQLDLNYPRPRQQRTGCRLNNVADASSSPVTMGFIDESLCQIKDGLVFLNCKCGLSSSNNNLTYHISNCEGRLNISKWYEWSNWSECSVKGIQTRYRRCTDINCERNSKEIKYCDLSKSHLKSLKSDWTEWIIESKHVNVAGNLVENSVQRKYRAICQLNKTQLSPQLEIQEHPCDIRCQEKLRQKWTAWSSCYVSRFRYRLYNCSSLDKCKPYQIQIKSCDLENPIFNVQQPDNKLQSGKSIHISSAPIEYSLIHLILAALVTSIVWLIILLIVVLKLLPYFYNRNYQHQHQHQHQHHNINQNHHTLSSYNRQASNSSHRRTPSNSLSFSSHNTHPQHHIHTTSPGNQINMGSLARNLPPTVFNEYVSYPTINESSNAFGDLITTPTRTGSAFSKEQTPPTFV